MLEILRFVFGAAFVVSGLFVLGVATLGLFRLNYVLNRIHASAKCDTLGTMLLLVGIIILMGTASSPWKLLIMIAFIWLTNPVSTHLIGNTEVMMNPYLSQECEVIEQ